MKIAMIGAGGVGGYYGGLLAHKGHDVTFVARGAHLQAIQQKGLQVKSVFGDFLIKPARATDDPAQVGAVDLILFCTKTYRTDEAALAAKALVGAETTVLSLQNGVDAVERIGPVLGPEHMIAGATWLSSAVAAPGIINQVSDFRRVVIGELDGGVTPRLQAVHDAFKETGASMEISDSILSVLWAKLIFISAAAGFGSVTRLPMAAYRGVPETRGLITALMHETSAVAAAHKINLDPDVVEKSLAFMDKAGPTIKASMQVDVEAGRPSELEALIGVIGRMGRERGVPTPVADMIYGSLLPADLKARGL
ncbi:MAG: 2-dehydropantoate 2-reductase [Chloroflexota bacterium]